MNPACDHCGLPVGRLGQRREVLGEARWFCCYGCCLAWQVHHGEREEPAAAAALIRLGLGGFLAMNIMAFSLLLYSGALADTDAWLAAAVHWLLWLLATPLLLILGGPFFAGAWLAARQRRMTADTLVSIGALVAYGYSAWQVVQGTDLLYFDTATMVLLLFTLGRYLEAQGRVRAARSLAPMLAAERAQVRVREPDGEVVRPVATVKPGDLVWVRPGERVAVDGVVVEGRSECDESVLTGQAEPRPKRPGALVHAGSMNGRGRLLVRATVAGTQTRWVRIGRQVRAALACKSLLGETIDRVAALFVPWVLLLAAATACFWATRIGVHQALLAGLAVLVVACPCSLGLAAPLATMLGIGRAAQHGILIRGGGVLEKLARLRSIAFDKTGTLTQGRLHAESLAVDGATTEEVLRRARALASGSDHPVARAVIALVRGSGDPAASARDLQAHPGAGISANVEGAHCAMGSRAFMAALGWAVPDGLATAHAAQSPTLVYVGWAGRVHGLFAFADRPLPEAAQVVAELRARKLPSLLLSGDGAAAVSQVATALGIAHWHAELLPEAKVGILREWITRHGCVAMVGDGLNDGPVLAAASVGIAVGGATDLARESADVTLPEDGLSALPWLIDLARDVRRSIRANLAWSLGYNAIALTLAAGGLLQPVFAAALMAGSSLLVVVRSLHAARAAGHDCGHAVPAAGSGSLRELAT